MDSHDGIFDARYVFDKTSFGTVHQPKKPDDVQANSHQVGGKHYQTEIQPWDFIHRNGIGYLAGNVIKYVCRYDKKNGVEDLQKARHYLDKLIEETSR